MVNSIWISGFDKKKKGDFGKNNEGWLCAD